MTTSELPLTDNRWVNDALLAYRHLLSARRVYNNLGRVYASPIPKKKEPAILARLNDLKANLKGAEEKYGETLSNLNEKSMKLFLERKDIFDGRASRETASDTGS